jgi:protein O-GlcNAc transferase
MNVAKSEAGEGRRLGTALVLTGTLALCPAGVRTQSVANDARAHDATGVALGDAGRLDEAIASFERAVAIDPTLPEPHFHLGLAYDRRDRPGEAIAHYVHALRLRPDYAEATYGLSTVCTKVGDLDGAIVLLRRITSRAPAFAEARYNLGLNLWNRFKASARPGVASDLDAAESELKEAVRLDPAQAPYHSALGQLLAERETYAGAIEHLRQAVALAPGDAEHAYNLGLALRLHGDLEGAEAQFRRALELKTNHTLARRSLGLVLRQKGDFPSAAAALQQSVTERLDDPIGHHLLGTVLLKLNRAEDAEREFREAARLDPSFTEARVSLAQSLARSGKREEALREQAAIREMNDARAASGRSLILLDRAAAHEKKGEWPQAIAQLREAATISADLAEARYRLGLALAEGSRDGAAAEAAFRRVLEIEPTHAHAHYQLGRLLARRGDREAAAAALRQAVTFAPSLVDAHRALAEIAMGSGNVTGAVDALEAALAWDPGNTAARALLTKAQKKR